MLQAKTEEQLEKVLSILEESRTSVIQSDENGLYIDDFITFEQMATIVDLLRMSAPKKELFEECWVAYRRKGIKKKALDYWRKLTDEEKENVLPHIRAYVSTRDLQFQKDFERYLRDKVFMTVVYQGNNIVYDPTGIGNDKDKKDVYTPICGGSLNWNDWYHCYIYTGWYTDGRFISDGYTDDNRPNGAKIMLNNGRGTIVWDSELKSWRKV